MKQKHRIQIDPEKCIGCGLGVLYSGFFCMAAGLSRPLRRALGLGRGEKAVATLVLGYSGVTYHRTAQKEAASVRRL